MNYSETDASNINVLLDGEVKLNMRLLKILQ